MKDLQQPQTTSCGSKGNTSRYPLDSPPKADHISQNLEQVGSQYGWVKIISPERRYTKGWSRCYVLTECQGCGRKSWTCLQNLTSGRSKGCQACSQPRQIPKWLDRRITAEKQRCQNPNDPGYENYGGRGIEFRFDSVTECGLYIMSLYPNLNRDMELDRIDNNGHYERGNIRMVTRKVNSGNRRITVLSDWDPQYWPYSETCTKRKLAAGMTREQVIESARKAVREKRKNWRGIQERLESMTYEMPDRITVIPYRGC